MLTHNQAREFYDSFGTKQDKQFYEESAMKLLLEHGDFTNAKNVVEFGCGTGKLATRLLNSILPSSCRYTGFDISQTMIDLCRKHIEPFKNRAVCLQNEGVPTIDVPAGSADHFISTYVMDLLNEDDIHILLNSAYRTLSTDGYLCLVGLTHGITLTSHVVETIWNGLFKLNPKIVGGCRPIRLFDKLQNNMWKIVYETVIVSYGIPSEVLVARKI